MDTPETRKEQHRRSQYKAVWTALSDAHDRAKLHVTGTAEEAARVLRPGRRLYVDNVSLCSEEGWAVFEAHRRFARDARPPHITECSTPQELETYLKRAGFAEIQIRAEGLFVEAWGHKPQGNVG